MNFKSVSKAALRHGKILWRGFTRMLYGAMTAGAFAMAAYGFSMIPSEGGYIAVFDFMAAIMMLCMAFTCMYHQGGGKRKKGGYEK